MKALVKKVQQSDQSAIENAENEGWAIHHK